MIFYLGSYTRQGGPGVAKCALEDGQMRILQTDALPNATFVIVNRAKDRLFAVCSDAVSAPHGGSAASYAIGDGGLTRLSRSDTLGDAPCHLCLSPDERFLYVANYLEGSVSVFAADAEGRLGPCLQHVRHEGRGPNAERQDGPHAHQVTFIPGTNLLCAIDLGIDAVMVYAQDPETGLLSLHDRLDTEPGLGPRHLLYGKDGLAYLVYELGGAVSVLRREDGRWRVLQTLPTLPAGYDGPTNSVAAVRETSDGRTLLVSNRGHNSLARYRIGADGLLTPDGILATVGDFPRDFDFVNDETLLIAHQNSDVDLCRLTARAIEPLASLRVDGAVCVCLIR